ncbi:MAG: hypothetical protein JXD18_02930 [Anaerolineae bacterium]|nr:hypothetical protein [Anaerolineae bacterium]
MRSVFRWIAANVGLFLLSLLLSTLIWAVAVEQENPTIEQPFRTPIPISVVNQPEGMLVYEQSAVQTSVTLRAPETVWQVLRADDFRAVIDMGGLGEGQHRLPIAVLVDQRPVAIQSLEPAEVTVTLERVTQVAVPVSVRIEGNTALGYVARMPVAETLTATVSGPSSLVERVAEAVAVVSVDGRRADIDEDFTLEAQDAAGDAIPHVTLSPSRVAVRVPIEQLRGFQELAVTPVLEGAVALGYRVADISVDPPVVTVYGRQDAIDAIAQSPGYLQTTPVTIDGMWESVEARVPLSIPDGVFLVGMDNPLVTVRVTIVPEEGSTTVVRTVSIQGWSPGITATVAPTMVQVILSGPMPILERLQEDDVLVLIDLFGRTPGSYSIQPRVVVVPAGVVADSVVPASIQLVVGVETTPTPTPESDK